MNIGGLRPGRLSEAELDALLATARSDEVTYDWVGATIDGGERHTLTSTDFDAASARLRAWAAPARIGARVHPADASIEVGTTLLVVLRLGPLEVVAPNRIVAVVDEPDRFGFAYGTLPGHPERGEEAFIVERDRVTVALQAAPGTVPARLASPVVRLFQLRAVRAYLDALAGV